MRGRALALLAAALAVGCAEDVDRVFECRSAEECGSAAGATCEPSGACSFSDTDCTSGRRYGELAPAPLADQCVPSTYAEEVLFDRPLGYWRVGEVAGSVARDEIGAHPGTYDTVTLGVPGAIAGDADTAFSTRHADGGHVDLGEAFAFSGTGSFSWEAWLRPETFAPVEANVVVSNGGPTDGYFVDAQAGVGFVRIAGGDGDRVEDPSPLPTDRYTHVVVTYDGAVMAVYRDGALVANQASAVALPASALHARVGSFSEGGSGFDGAIDEVAVYDRALAEERIRVHQEKGTGVAAASW